jgi:hypothetical protein
MHILKDFFFCFACYGLLDFNFLKIGRIVTLSRDVFRITSRKEEGDSNFFFNSGLKFTSKVFRIILIR